MMAKSTEDAENCLELCKNISGCQWFTFVSYENLCKILSYCDELDAENCLDCISGEVNC